MVSNSPRYVRSGALVVICCLAWIGAGPTPSRADEAAPVTWDAVLTDVHTLRAQEKYDEALALIERAAPEFPGYGFELSDLTLQILFGAGRAEEALAAWERGLDEGYFYFVVPRLAIYDAVRNHPRFRAALARNNLLRETANRGSRPELKVITPASYSPDRSYPLLMVLHGGNQSIAKAMERWAPGAMGDDLIIAYLQSSRMAATRSYRWDLGGVDVYSAPTAQGEVRGLYEAIMRDYSVDVRRVFLAGFSQGGNLALTMAAEGSIPAAGFIAGCPAIRSPIQPETVRTAAARGLRGTIFVGAEDWTAAPVETTVASFNDAGIAVNHIVMKGKGHEFPDDFDAVLREAVDFIVHRD